MDRRWLVKRTNPEYIRYISKAVSISPALTQILINRGIKTLQEINDFLNPHLSDLSDPFDLIGIKAAVERIKYAIGRNEKVLVHGDYDADGLTATAIMVQALRMHGLVAHYFIPNRIIHGYGFSPASINFAKEIGATLIITVDCGITSFDTASYAKQEGIDVIITDHHEPAAETWRRGDAEKQERENNSPIHPFTDSPIQKFKLPDAVAIVNPKLETCNLRLSNLSGAGVAFKIVQALDLELRTQNSELLLDLAAIGTIADVVPLTGENRILVREGMKLIKEGQRVGIRAIKSVTGLDEKELRVELLSFTIIPRINAAGRIANSQDVVRLLISDIDREVSDLSLWLDRLNSERQKIEEDVYQKALAKVNTEGFDSVIVLSGEGWHQGVIGIVASRIAEEFYRPTFVFSIEKGIAKGSARSIPSFDICRGLALCREFLPEGLLSFGGHKQAAGLRLKAEDISVFKKAIEDVTKNALTKDNLVPLLGIDADISLSEANHNLIKELAMLEPLGYGNAEPLFGSRRLEVINPRIVGNNHLKMRLKQGSQAIDAIGFDMGDFQPPNMIDAVFTLIVNEYNGNRYPQMKIKALRPTR